MRLPPRLGAATVHPVMPTVRLTMLSQRLEGATALLVEMCLFL